LADVSRARRDDALENASAVNEAGSSRRRSRNGCGVRTKTACIRMIICIVFACACVCVTGLCAKTALVFMFVFVHLRMMLMLMLRQSPMLQHDRRTSIPSTNLTRTISEIEPCILFLSFATTPPQNVYTTVRIILRINDNVSTKTSPLALVLTIKPRVPSSVPRVRTLILLRVALFVFIYTLHVRSRRQRPESIQVGHL
jgi:hypothetical protein